MFRSSHGFEAGIISHIHIGLGKDAVKSFTRKEPAPNNKKHETIRLENIMETFSLFFFISCGTVLAFILEYIYKKSQIS